jgi:3',5'-cyclic AMP phosphodiesterase CpdA
MGVLLHISDTHFGTEQAPVVEALVALAAQQRPDVVVLSGDITQRARPAQFRAAKACVERLGAPVLAIPGNHDIALFDLWARLTRPYARFSAVFGADLEPVFTSPDWLVVGVNTTRARRHRHGEVSAAQIERVTRLLANASPRQLRVVVVHQPVAVPLDSERHNLLRGHAQATRAWAAAGADLVLGGHIHLPFTLALDGLVRRLWAVQAGTAVSARTRSGVPNSVNILRWGAATEHGSHSAPARALPDGCCLIERWDFDQRERAFVHTGTTTVQPERG